MRKSAMVYISLGLWTAAGPALGNEGLELSSPLVMQVYQRDKQEQAAVRIEGGAPAGATIVEAKADLSADATRGKSADWTTIAKDGQIKDGQFAGQCVLATGGWYTIVARARRNGEIVAQTQVEMVGVGDVFITAGQSNSANAGEPPQRAESDRVVYFDGRSSVPARDPIPGSFGEGGSPWSILGDMLTRTTQAPVCFRSTSLHWAPVREWLPNAQSQWPFYKTLVERTKWFGPHGVRAVLWHQGEDDASAKTSAEQYAKELGTVIESMRKDVGYPVDWFVAAASYCQSGDVEAEQEVVRGQKLLWTRGVTFRGPDTNDLLRGYRARDGGHFGPLGLRTHAERWYAELSAQYGFANPVSTALPVSRTKP